MVASYSHLFAGQVEDMGHHTINGEITALTWLGYNAIVILTNLNEMQVFDPFSLQVLETSSLEGMHIAFHQRLTEAYGATEGCYRYFCADFLMRVFVPLVSLLTKSFAPAIPL